MIVSFVALSLLLTACGVIFQQVSPMSPRFSRWNWDSYETNGEKIYFTGTNQDGRRIPYTSGPSTGGMMMGQRLTCGSCHGSNGRGGVHTMHMDVMDAPDIRFSALNGEDDHEEDGGGEHHAGEYDLEAFRQAVVGGQHPNGEPLDRDMPRWQLTDQDLEDLLDFLKSLS